MLVQRQEYKLIGVICYVEDETSSVFNHDPQVWRSLTQSLGADYVIFIDENKTMLNWSDGNLSYRVDTLEEALDMHPNDVPMYVYQHGETDYRDFDYCNNIKFVFGKDASDFDSLKPSGLRIPSKKPLWALNACAIILSRCELV